MAATQKNVRNQNVFHLLRNRRRALRMANIAAFACAAILGTLGLSAPIHAQTHSASLSFTKSPDTANTNVYRLAAVCPTGTLTGFVKLTATPITVATYTDGTVVPGVYCYYVTATLNGVESIPSNTVQASIPVAPPSGLTLTSVAITNVNGQDRLQVDWSDTHGATTAITIFGGSGQVLKQGSQTSSIGVYSYVLLFPPQSGTVSICDQKGCVTQAFQG